MAFVAKTFCSRDAESGELYCYQLDAQGRKQRVVRKEWQQPRAEDVPVVEEKLAGLEKKKAQLQIEPWLGADRLTERALQEMELEERAQRLKEFKEQHAVEAARVGLAWNEPEEKREGKDAAKRLLQKIVEEAQRMPRNLYCYGRTRWIVPWFRHLLARVPHLSICATPPIRVAGPGHSSPTAEQQEQEKQRMEELRSCVATSDLTAAFLNLTLQPKDHHGNMLIIDKTHRTFERFDPHGGVELQSSWADAIVREWPAKFSDEKEWRYLSPLDWCPHIGPQRLVDATSVLRCRDADESGFCVIFAILYLHLRLLDMSLPREVVVSALTDLGKQALLDLAFRYATLMAAAAYRLSAHFVLAENKRRIQVWYEQRLNLLQAKSQKELEKERVVAENTRDRNSREAAAIFEQAVRKIPSRWGATTEREREELQEYGVYWRTPGTVVEEELRKAEERRIQEEEDKEEANVSEDDDNAEEQKEETQLKAL